MTVTHVAGIPLVVRDHVRQRCGWCGALIADYELDTPGAFFFNAHTLVRIDAGSVVAVTANYHPDGSVVLPVDACANVDVAVTA